MSGLVLELQSKAIEGNVSVSELLRMALVVATKLKSEEMKKWVSDELNGYKSSEDVLDYRKIHGQVKYWNPYHGWQSVVFDDKMSEILSHRTLTQSASELEALCVQDLASKEGVVYISIPDQVKTLINKMTSFPIDPVLHVSIAAISGIVESVKGYVLNWALELEENGILGEGMSFSKKEKEIANAISYNVTNNISSMNNSQIQQLSNDSIQTYSSSFDVKDLLGFVERVRALDLSAIVSGDEYKELVSDLETLKSQAESSRPKMFVIKGVMESVLEFLQKTAVNMIPTEILVEGSRLLASIA